MFWVITCKYKGLWVSHTLVLVCWVCVCWFRGKVDSLCVCVCFIMLGHSGGSEVPVLRVWHDTGGCVLNANWQTTRWGGTDGEVELRHLHSTAQAAVLLNRVERWSDQTFTLSAHCITTPQNREEEEDDNRHITWHNVTLLLFMDERPWDFMHKTFHSF